MPEPWHKELAGHPEGVLALGQFMGEVRQGVTDVLIALDGLRRDLPVVWASDVGQAFADEMSRMPASLEAVRAAHSLCADTLMWAVGELHAAAEALSGERARGEAAVADLGTVKAEYALHVETVRAQSAVPLLIQPPWPSGLEARRKDAQKRRDTARAAAAAAHARARQALDAAKDKLEEMAELAYQDSPLLAFLQSVPLVGKDSAAWMSHDSNRDLVHYAIDSVADGLAMAAVVATPIAPLAAVLKGASGALTVIGLGFRAMDVLMEVDPVRRPDRAREMGAAAGAVLGGLLTGKVLQTAKPGRVVKVLPSSLQKTLHDKGVRFDWHGHDVSVDGRYRLLSRPLDRAQDFMTNTLHLGEDDVRRARKALLGQGQGLPDAAGNEVESRLEDQGSRRGEEHGDEVGDRLEREIRR